jgi:16S rRNA U1498 N3-methylase RsmE
VYGRFVSGYAFRRCRSFALMTRRRWIADETSGDRAALVGAHADHLVRVLRARVGEDFDIVTGQSVRRGRITSVKSDKVEFDLGEVVPAASLAEITLVLAVRPGHLAPHRFAPGNRFDQTN